MLRGHLRARVTHTGLPPHREGTLGRLASVRSAVAEGGDVGLG